MRKGLKQGQARPAGDQCAWPSEGTEARIDAEEHPCPAFLSAHFVFTGHVVTRWLQDLGPGLLSTAAPGKVPGLCVSLASWESHAVPEPITEAGVRGALLGWWGCGLNQCGEEQSG